MNISIHARAYSTVFNCSQLLLIIRKMTIDDYDNSGGHELHPITVITTS